MPEQKLVLSALAPLGGTCGRQNPIIHLKKLCQPRRQGIDIMLLPRSGNIQLRVDANMLKRLGFAYHEYVCHRDT